MTPKHFVTKPEFKQRPIYFLLSSANWKLLVGQPGGPETHLRIILSRSFQVKTTGIQGTFKNGYVVSLPDNWHWSSFNLRKHLGAIGFLDNVESTRRNAIKI